MMSVCHKQCVFSLYHHLSLGNLFGGSLTTVGQGNGMSEDHRKQQQLGALPANLLSFD